MLNYSREQQSTIARFDPIENNWTKLGDLIAARSGHGVIQVNNEFLVFGGSRKSYKDEPTESCKLTPSLILVNMFTKDLFFRVFPFSVKGVHE